MRQILLFVSVMLLGLTWAVAQSTSTPSSSGSSAGYGAQQGAGQDSTGTAAGSGHQTHSGAGGQMSVEGCLSGSNGNFTLTAKNGKTYELTGDTATLTEHVGHEVKVMGMSGSGESGSAASAGGAAGSGQTLQVSSVKHISKTCKAGGGGMSH